MIRLIGLIFCVFLPMLVLAQHVDHGAKSVRDSLVRDSLRRADSVKLRADSIRTVTDSLKHTDSAKAVRDSLRRTDSARLARKAQDSIHFSNMTKYKWSWAATGNINNTNTVSSYLVSNAASVSAVRKKSALNLSTSWVYGAQAGNLTNNDFTSTVDFNMYKTIRHFYYWGLVNYNTSLSLRVNNLLQSGGGFGYNLVDKKTAAVLISDGVLYENGDLYQVLYGGPGGNEPVRDKYQVLRNSFRLKFHFVIHDRIVLDGVELIQHSLASIHNYILNLSASGSVKLNKWLAVTTAFNFNKFTRTRSENTLITFGFTVSR